MSSSYALNVFKSLSGDDRRTFCCNFVNVFRNEFFRAKSFDSCRDLKPHGIKLSRRGLYYSGDKIDAKTGDTVRCISCFFCSFSMTLPISYDDDSPDFAAIETAHAKLVTAKCSQKRGNIPVIIRPLEKYNIYTTSAGQTVSDHSLMACQWNDVIITENDSSPESSSSSSAVEMQPSICGLCNLRQVSVIYRPCGCIIACATCNSRIPFYKCLNCNSDILAYGKMYLP